MTLCNKFHSIDAMHPLLSSLQPCPAHLRCGHSAALRPWEPALRWRYSNIKIPALRWGKKYSSCMYIIRQYICIYVYMYREREREIVITHKYGHKCKPDLLSSFLLCVRYNILLHHSFTWRVFLETLVHWIHIHHRAGPTPTSSVSRSNHAWDVFVLLPTRPSAPAFYGDRLILEVWSSFDLMSSKRSLVTWHVSQLVEATHLSK